MRYNQFTRLLKQLEKRKMRHNQFTLSAILQTAAKRKNASEPIHTEPGSANTEREMRKTSRSHQCVAPALFASQIMLKGDWGAAKSESPFHTKACCVADAESNIGLCFLHFSVDNKIYLGPSLRRNVSKRYANNSRIRNKTQEKNPPVSTLFHQGSKSPRKSACSLSPRQSFCSNIDTADGFVCSSDGSISCRARCRGK